MDVAVIVTEEAKAGCTGGTCRSAASTAIITGFLAVVTRLLDQVQYAAVFIYGLVGWTDNNNKMPVAWRDRERERAQNCGKSEPRKKKWHDRMGCDKEGREGRMRSSC